jgi:D-beta-D-heptose 7-phosphate kinase/D-beta-D-heptose 1-phosphate adenosyltransferase
LKLERRRLESLLEAFSRVRLLVLGDVVLDEYVWGDVERVSPEAPVPVVHVQHETVVLGGAGNVVRNIVALGGRAAFCSVVGDDAAGRTTAGLLKDLGVDPAGLVVAESRPTTRKTRVVARSQQIVRFDRETSDAVDADAASRLGAALAAACEGCDGVVVEDYGKGVLTPPAGSDAMALFRARSLPVVLDPKADLAPFRGASLVKPNLREAEALTGISIRSDADLAAAAARLRDTLGGADVVVTRGVEGMTLFESGRADGVDVRTAPREVYDVQGAGDTSIAALALALRAGASLPEAAVLANAAAGVVVGKVGTATASAGEVRERLPDAIAAAGGDT